MIKLYTTHSELKDAISNGYAQALKDAQDCECGTVHRNREIELSVHVNGEKADTHYLGAASKLTAKKLNAAFDDLMKVYPDAERIAIDSGIDSAESVREMCDGDYECWTGEFGFDIANVSGGPQGLVLYEM